MQMERAKLCVTEGAIEQLPGGHLSVSVAKMRAYVTTPTAQVVEVRFTYLGPTGHEALLGSGELRRQFGLKLRAQDACNLVYAMWRIEPESKIVISVKSNPGQHSSTECGNRGYRNIKPRRAARVPALKASDSHVLRAELEATQLRVFVDGTVVWEGDVEPSANSVDGPVGLRSDNARLEFELFAAELPRGSERSIPPCHEGTGESDEAALDAIPEQPQNAPAPSSDAAGAPIPLAADSLVAQGQARFTAYKCYECHGAHGEGTDEAPDLTGTRRNAEEIASFLQKPSPDARSAGMPTIPASSPDLQPLVAFVLSLKRSSGP
jgi:mono/diheme cytochrome c family protein